MNDSHSLALPVAFCGWQPLSVAGGAFSHLEVEAMNVTREKSYLQLPWQTARFAASEGICDIETVERGDDLPEQGCTIAKVYSFADEPGPYADFIVRACNSHHDLLSACEQLLTYITGWVDEDQLGAAWHNLKPTVEHAISNAQADDC